MKSVSIIRLQVVVLSVICALNTNAMLIKNMTTGDTIGYDDFEAATTVDGNAYNKTAVDADPDYPTFGTWVISEDFSGVIQVSDYGVPGAYAGDNYLRIHKNASAPVATFNVAEQTTLNDTIHFETMVNHSAGASSFENLMGETSANDSVWVASILCAVGKSIFYNDGTGNIDTGLDFITDTWQKMEIDWVVGADTFSLTFDGATVSGLTVRSTDAVSFTGVFLRSEVIGKDVYFDAVPEPVTVGLMALGGLVTILVRKYRS